VQARFFCRPAGVDFFPQRVEPVDIGCGGLRFYSDEEYAVGAFVRLEVFSPSGPLVGFTGEVIWIRAAGRPAPARHDVGLAFLELTSEALKFLGPLLEQGRDDDPPATVRRVRARAHSYVRVTVDGPSSEVRPTVSGPASVRQKKASDP
jgi:hypothetical protein